jgi:hypothetical protein
VRETNDLPTSAYGCNGTTRHVADKGRELAVAEGKGNGLCLLWYGGG